MVLQDYLYIIGDSRQIGHHMWIAIYVGSLFLIFINVIAILLKYVYFDDMLINMYKKLLLIHSMVRQK